MKNIKWTAPISQQVEEEKKKSCLASLGQTLRKFNPCLRPQKQSQTLTQFLDEFKQVSLYHDPYFGEVFLLESLAHGQEILLKKQKLYESEVEERLRSIRQLESFKNNPHIVSQTLIERIQKVSFLWSKVELYIAYDFIVFDLQKQFEYRMTKGTRFSQRQIISIMKGACKGYIHLQPTDYSSIRMSYIYFTRKGFIKIAHPDLFHYKTNLQNICEHDESKGIYLSPQEMKCLENGEKDAILGWKSNSFVFGMVILSLMSQSHLNQIYDYSGCYIDRSKIDQLLRNCKNTYSQKLRGLVEKLIEQRPEERMNFRTLLTNISNGLQTNNQVDLQLLNQEGKPVEIDHNYGQGLQKSFNPKQEEPHVNYLSGLIYPKIGKVGEFYNEGGNSLRVGSLDDQSIIAEQRHFYANRNSQYIGGAKSGLSQVPGQQKFFREGKGYYRNQDGQVYIGDWVKGEMSGYGKLYWNQQKIRYDGDFVDGKFHGRGVEFNGDSNVVGDADEDDEPDHTFVRLQRNNWVKYEGNFIQDKKQGQGIVYFKTGKWMGNFRQDQPNGQGVFVDNKGVSTKGVWKNGLKV